MLFYSSPNESCQNFSQWGRIAHELHHSSTSSLIFHPESWISENGDVWSHFFHNHAKSRAFRWSRDGIAGVCDSHGLPNIAFGFLNQKDAFLKEWLFKLSNPWGNLAESIKKAHFHLDNVPTHSYRRYLYRYPSRSFPYEILIKQNAKRGKADKEYQLIDTGIFEENRYWDIFEITKESDDEEELLFLTAYKWGSEAAPLQIAPHVLFRNTWTWGLEKAGGKPSTRQIAPLTENTGNLAIDSSSSFPHQVLEDSLE